MFQVFLNGTLLVDEPKGLDEIEITLKRDKTIRGLLISSTSQLMFWGDGYEFLRLQRVDRLCETVTVEIFYTCKPEEEFQLLFTGVIFVADGEKVKFNTIRCTVTSDIEDANFGARIGNNKRIEAIVNVNRSKNDIFITPAAPTLVDFHDPDNNTTPVSRENRTCYKISECLRYMIDFMSDGEIDFESDYYETGTGSNLYLVTGQEIRLGDNLSAPLINFEDLFDQLFRKDNISFTIIDGNTMKIEPTDDLLLDTVSVVNQGLQTVQEYIDNSSLFAKVLLGSEDNTEAGEFPEIRFDDFSEEEYHMLGECNTEEELDLRGVFLYDHNTIEAVLDGLVDNDEDVFIVEVNINSLDPSKFRTTGFDLFQLSPKKFFFNGDFRNSQIILNFFGALPNSIASFLGGTSNFTAGFIDAPSDAFNLFSGDVLLPVPYDDDNDPGRGLVDPGNNYSTVTFRYTVPATGVYAIRTVSTIVATVNIPDINTNAQTRVRVRRLDSGAVLIGTFGKTFDFNAGLIAFPFDLEFITPTANLNAGDLIEVSIEQINVSGATTRVFYSRDSIFETHVVANGGGVYQTFDEKDVNLLITEYDKKIAFEDAQNIINNNNEKIRTEGLNNFIRESHIEEWVYKVNIGDTHFKLFGKNVN